MTQTITNVADHPTFTYDQVAIDDLHVVKKVDAKSGKEVIDYMLVNDEPLQPSERFFTSLFARFGFNKSFFKYFDHSEVFGRIADREPNDRVRICVERKDTRKGPTNRLLAVSNPTKPIVPHEELMGMLSTSGSEGITYHDGIIESTHKPRVGSNSFDIMGDKFANRFIMATPVDGYGQPNVYLSMLRMVCSNGMIGLSKAFKSSVSLGRGDDNVAFALTRVLDQFGNDEGYAALRQRLESSTQSWASMYEAITLYKLLIRLHSQSDENGDSTLRIAGGVGTDGGKLSTMPYVRKLVSQSDPGSLSDDAAAGSPILTAYHSMTGDTSRLYGLANPDALSQKRQRTLPVKCTVYDMLNFATEVATHYATPQASRKLNAWVGSLVSSEYDMEGTCEKFSDFADFHLTSKFSEGLTGSEHAARN